MQSEGLPEMRRNADSRSINYRIDCLRASKTLLPRPSMHFNASHLSLANRLAHRVLDQGICLFRHSRLLRHLNIHYCGG